MDNTATSLQTLIDSAVADAARAATEAARCHAEMTIYEDPNVGGWAYIYGRRSVQGEDMTGGIGHDAEDYGDRFEDAGVYNEGDYVVRMEAVRDALIDAGFTVHGA